MTSKWIHVQSLWTMGHLIKEEKEKRKNVSHMRLSINSLILSIIWKWTTSWNIDWLRWNLRSTSYAIMYDLSKNKLQMTKINSTWHKSIFTHLIGINENTNNCHLYCCFWSGSFASNWIANETPILSEIREADNLFCKKKTCWKSLTLNKFVPAKKCRLQ